MSLSAVKYTVAQLILEYFLQPNNPKYVEELQILDKIFKKNPKASQTHELALI